MPNDLNPRAITGANNPPPYRAEVVEQHDTEARNFLDAAAEWLQAGPIGDADQAAKLNDWISGAKGKVKAIDSDRVTDKKPHDEAGKLVQGAYTPILDKMKRAIERVSPLMGDWLQREQKRQQEEAARKRAEAEAAARAAEESARKAASRTDIAGEVEAEEAAKRAAEMQKEADRLANARVKSTSATGGGRAISMRTHWRAEIHNVRIAFLEFQDAPEVAEALRNLAERRARSRDFDPTKQTIPGINLIKEEKPV